MPTILFLFLWLFNAQLALGAVATSSSYLIQAAQGNNTREALRLIIQNVTIDSQDLSGRSALFYAVLNDNTKLAITLLERNANPRLNSRLDESPLSIATRNNNMQVFCKLYDQLRSHPPHQIDIDRVDKWGRTALIYAAMSNNLEFVQILLKLKSDPNKRSSWNETALMFAAHFNNLEMASLLLSFGSNPNFADNDGITPLHVACRHNQAKLVALLLEYDANINALTKDMYTPLEYAAVSASRKITNLLISNGANLDLVNIARLVQSFTQWPSAYDGADLATKRLFKQIFIRRQLSSRDSILICHSPSSLAKYIENIAQDVPLSVFGSHNEDSKYLLWVRILGSLSVYLQARKTNFNSNYPLPTPSQTVVFEILLFDLVDEEALRLSKVLHKIVKFLKSSIEATEEKPAFSLFHPAGLLRLIGFEDAESLATTRLAQAIDKLLE